MEQSASDPGQAPASRDQDAALGPSPDLAAELASARERLAFYESFDALIQDNVRRSGDLLRQVAAEREAVEQRLLTMRAELDARLAEQRTVLEAIAGSLADVESSLGSVTAQVQQSLATLSVPAAPASQRIADEGDDAQASVDEALVDGGAGNQTTNAERAEPDAVAPELAFPTPPVELDPVGELPASSAPAVDVRAAAADDATPDPDGDAVDETAMPGPRKIDLVIHGVPRAATALSIQRHLQDLAGVEVVEVREYVSGVLRFQVVATDFGPEDVMQWEGGGLQTINAHQNVLELRLPSAENV